MALDRSRLKNGVLFRIVRKLRLKSIARKIIPAKYHSVIKTKLIDRIAPSVSPLYLEKLSYYRAKREQMELVRGRIDVSGSSGRFIKRLNDANNKSKFLVYPLVERGGDLRRYEKISQRFVNKGYICIALVLDQTALYVDETAPGRYVTNLFSETLDRLKDKSTVLYLSNPSFSHLVNFLHPNFLIYDVVDNLSNFPGSPDGVKDDHDYLLAISNLIVFKSKSLCSKNGFNVDGRGCVLATDGSVDEWGRQFKKALNLIRASGGRKIFSKRVDIINVNFFDRSGEVLFKGGAERYVYDLAVLIKSMGHYPRIIQNSNDFFERDYRGIKIVGLPLGDDSDYVSMSEQYNAWTSGADLVIASPLELACCIKETPVIGVNHGIYWDNNGVSLEHYSIDRYKNTFRALQNVVSCVCVDTNFINWLRTYDYKLSGKLVYIPNYFDKLSFKYASKSFHGQEVEVLYPRRLYEARGIFITLEAFDYLLPKYPNLRLRLVGQVDNDRVASSVDSMMKKYSKQIILEELDMTEMAGAYENSHIVLIPTMYSEGTSLSCIEAMTTNNAIVATNVGGLPNLVIDGHNGLLINPTSKGIIKSIERLIADRRLVSKMAERNLQISESFEKSTWQDRWISVLSSNEREL